ncbi:MAG: hypothetical protein JSV65_00150 [Armatimonadota bacterium]|nr:MAG: hypothetical protein JSV65_00150 [Armatimonadota bacterium]
MTIYDSGFGSRALISESEAADNWPQALWYAGDERLDNDAPLGRYVLWAVALDERGVLARAQTHIEVKEKTSSP